MALGTAAILGAAATVGGAAISAGASNRAANAQVGAARDQLELQKGVYEDQTARFSPFLNAGTNALAPYLFEMGLGPRPEGFDGLSMSPAARFAMTEGRDTIEAGGAARGGLFSGATLGGLERMRMGLATQDRETQLNRLAGLVDMGQGAAGMQASAGGNFAAGASNAIGARGNALAAGAIGSANALNAGINNGMGLFGFMNNRATPGQMGGTVFNQNMMRMQ